MRVLIVKLSSMGDILHTLPALTECLSYFPDIKFDWIVEPGFKEMLSWHPGIQHVYTFPLRAARKNLKLFLTEIPKALKTLRTQHYDLVIDAQGLIKSALLAKIINSKKRVGLDKHSCREPLASWLYNQSYRVPWSDHAIMRIKKLFSQIFGYAVLPEINYGIDKTKLIKPVDFSVNVKHDFLIFLHGTTWKTKHWPEQYWKQLIDLICVKNSHIKILLPWGSEAELTRATRLASVNPQVKVLPKLTITELGYYIAQAQAVVAVDTGLGHLAAALDIKTINLYGPTDPSKTGTLGLNQLHLAVEYACAPCLKRQCIYDSSYPPCYQSISTDKIMEKLVL